MISLIVLILQDTLPFPYDLERIIDDWILMGFLVGNDFIPHLPNLHINHVSIVIKRLPLGRPIPLLPFERLRSIVGIV